MNAAIKSAQVEMAKLNIKHRMQAIITLSKALCDDNVAPAVKRTTREIIINHRNAIVETERKWLN